MEIPVENLQVYEAPCYDAKCCAVFKGSFLHDDVAVKSLGSGNTSRATVSIFSGETPRPDLLRDLKHEVSIMRRLTHKNIVRFKGVVVNPPSIVTEYCEKGSLWNILSEYHGATKAFWGINDEAVWMWRIDIALQIAKGMYYLHWQVPIVLHNDLKSPNVFIDDNWVVKIGDFGSATVGDDECRNPPDNNTWKSPEQMKDQKPTAKSDVFSFAVILWELYSFDRPWDNLCETSSYPAKMAMYVKNHQIRERVLRGERLQFPTNIIGGNCNGMQDDFRKLTEMCWHPNPDLRPDFGKIIDILNGFQNRLRKPKSGLEELNLMSMKDLLQKNHPSQISQGKCSSLDSKTHSLNTDGGSSKDSSKRPVSKHSQRKWRFFNMVKFVQKVKPPFLGANKKTASTTNHSKDSSYQFSSVDSDQSSSNTSSPIKLPMNQLKSPFETGPAVKLNGFTMGDNTFCEHKTRDLDSSRISTGFDGRLSLDSDTRPTISGKGSSILSSENEMLSSYDKILSDDEVTDQLVEFEESLHDYFANDSSSFEGLDAYIQFAKEYHEEVSFEKV